MKIKFFILMVGVCLIVSNHAKAQINTTHSERYQPKPYVPASPALYNTIVELDSLYFNTYNTCNLTKMDSLTSDDLEFYHDKGGFYKSKKEEKNKWQITRVISLH